MMGDVVPLFFPPRESRDETIDSIRELLVHLGVHPQRALTLAIGYRQQFRQFQQHLNGKAIQFTLPPDLNEEQIRAVTSAIEEAGREYRRAVDRAFIAQQIGLPSA